jgi:hypothetical protein
MWINRILLTLAWSLARQILNSGFVSDSVAVIAEKCYCIRARTLIYTLSTHPLPPNQNLRAPSCVPAVTPQHYLNHSQKAHRQSQRKTVPGTFAGTSCCAQARI